MSNDVPASSQLARRRAEALEHQRIKQQGKGRPIISHEVEGVRFVTVGDRVAYGPWQGFQDFLFRHLRFLFGLEEDIIHNVQYEEVPLYAWLRALHAIKDRHAAEPSKGTDWLPAYGAARAVYGLAYDLYLIEHNASRPEDKAAFAKLVAKLRSRHEFYGARHEARVAGIFIRAGFDIEWEDDGQGLPGGHAEFFATYPDTKRRFWVECKMRQPEDDDADPRVSHLVANALNKKTSLERLVFVELNLKSPKFDDVSGGWASQFINKLRRLEQQPSSSSLPAALVVFMNHPEYRFLDSADRCMGALMEGFNTGDAYRTGVPTDLLDAVGRRRRDKEIEVLWESVMENAAPPLTFDGTIPWLDDSTRLLIGERYVLDDDVSGILESGVVMEEWKAAFCTFVTEEGRSHYNVDLTEDELYAFKLHPNTFFGVVQDNQGSESSDALALHEFFVEGSRALGRDELLARLSDESDAIELMAKSEAELRDIYAYRMVASANERNPFPGGPDWHKRLRGRRARR
ncbi:hypothetical protein [Pseudoxanthomonas mexicana]|uniref:hypothetical protein n=1 Tax=Pseudoxanthomonas mexicana TaxID=128785 RepID=UPI001FD484C4|nr:hypothetical protein [Pseudoxanthomonas mexicana]